MSTVISISTERRYGVARVCRVWGVARAGIYRGNSTATLRLKASPWYIAWRTGPFYRVLGRLRRTATPIPNA